MAKQQRRVVVFAGRFTASAAQFNHALDYLFFDKDVRATDVLMSEVSPDRYRKIIENYLTMRDLHGWHPKKPGADECVIISRDKLKRKGFVQLTRLRIKVGRTDPIHLIEAKVKKGPWLSMWHTAAHNFGLRRGVWATVIYMSTLGPYRKRLRERSRARKGSGSGGDFNYDLGREDAESTILGQNSKYHFTEEPGGKRQIVGFATNMEIIEYAKELKKLDGFDHPPVLSVVETLA